MYVRIIAEIFMFSSVSSNGLVVVSIMRCYHPRGPLMRSVSFSGDCLIMKKLGSVVPALVKQRELVDGGLTPIALPRTPTIYLRSHLALPRVHAANVSGWFMPSSHFAYHSKRQATVVFTGTRRSQA
jgi:hypothetical protein